MSKNHLERLRVILRSSKLTSYPESKRSSKRHPEKVVNRITTKLNCFKDDYDMPTRHPNVFFLTRGRYKSFEVIIIWTLIRHPSFKRRFIMSIRHFYRITLRYVLIRMKKVRNWLCPFILRVCNRKLLIIVLVVYNVSAFRSRLADLF